MPKSLHGWLHYQALRWMMPDEAVQTYIDGKWHRASGTESWTKCGRWVAGRNKRSGAGYGPSHYRRQSPWSNEGSIKITQLCAECFAVEMPLLVELQRVAVPHPQTGVEVDQ